MPEFTKVTCHLGAGGLILRTYEEIKGPFETVSHLEKDRFHLKSGPNEVPTEFWDDWMKVNSGTRFITEKFIEVEGKS